MKFHIKLQFFWYSIISIALMSACSTTKPVSVDKSKSTAKVETKSSPWYQSQKDFFEKGGWYYSLASSISTDSLRALDKAQKSAVIQLNNGMQTALENLRTNMVKEEGKNALADKPDFIWLMRGATFNQMNKAEKNRSEVVSKNGIYQAYVEMKYSRKQLIDDLFHAFAVNETYQNSVKKSQAFNHWYSSINSNDSTKTAE